MGLKKTLDNTLKNAVLKAGETLLLFSDRTTYSVSCPTSGVYISFGKTIEIKKTGTVRFKTKTATSTLNRQMNTKVVITSNGATRRVNIAGTNSPISSATYFSKDLTVVSGDIISFEAGYDQYSNMTATIMAIDIYGDILLDEKETKKIIKEY
ncbi:hypothetical protein QN089_05665 [Kurthia sp. YJT4]|uniref:hypothetical protein n=1 Tax=Kurthia sp. YJT4 TaxID=3049086 RepID=UPI00254C060A|nr:hypothetical protein [Kurthia sp. YJT4]WIL39756.1 hypothetical protein QN089_05665 [Kurthia sp. YJT4]